MGKMFFLQSKQISKSDRFISLMNIELQYPWTIICEGIADQAFFLNMIQERGLPNFDVPFPTKESGGGRSAFAGMLSGLRVATKPRKIDAILIVSDNDDDPGRSFGEVQKQIRLAEDYPIPETPMQVARAEGQPAILIMMLPWTDIPGCLESLYKKIFLRTQNPLMECVDEFLKCACVTRWEEVQKRDKAAFQCFIAGSNKEDPNKGLANLLRKTNHQFNRLFPVTAPEFDGIANVLQNFGAIVAD